MASLTSIWDAIRAPVNDNLNTASFPANLSYNTVHPNDQKPVYLIKPNMAGGPWIAGGAVLRWYENTPIGASDIDVFCKSKTQSNDLIKTLNQFKSCSIVFTSDNAVTYHMHDDADPYQIWRIQIITKDYFSNPQDIINRFDISVCKLVTDGETTILGENTAADIRTKTLRMSYPLRNDSPKRFIKYLAYGYRPVQGLYEHILNNDDISWTITDGDGYNGI